MSGFNKLDKSDNWDRLCCLSRVMDYWPVLDVRPIEFATRRILKVVHGDWPILVVKL